MPWDEESREGRLIVLVSQILNWNILHRLTLNSQRPCDAYIEGILPKGPYLSCVIMADRALLAGYPRYEPVRLVIACSVPSYNTDHCWFIVDLSPCKQMSVKFESKFNDEHSRKLSWKCHLQNGTLYVPVPQCVKLGIEYLRVTSRPCLLHQITKRQI